MFNYRSLIFNIATQINFIYYVLIRIEEEKEKNKLLKNFKSFK